MTAITSNATGFWDDTATWVGGVVPGNGDTVLITSTHVVTVRTNITVGHSPPSNDATPAIDVGATARLIVDAVQLTCRGDLRLIGNSTVRDALTIQGIGGVFEFDASQATTPLSQRYRLILGTGNFQYPRIKMVGTSHTQRVTMRSNTSGGLAFITVNGNTGVTLLDVTFGIFRNMADGSNVFFAFSLGNQTQMEMKLADVLFDGCGALSSSATPNATADCNLERVVWKNTLGSSCFSAGPGPATNKARFVDCYPDKACTFSDTANWTFDDTVLNLPWTLGGTTQWDSAQRVLLRNTSNGAPTQTQGPCRDWYVLLDHTGNNPHGLSIRSNTTPGDFEGTIFDYQGNAEVGDLFNIGAGAAGRRTVTVKKSIQCRNAAGHQAGKLVSTLGANNDFTIEHNSMPGSGNGTQSETGILEYGESGNGADGDFDSVQSNLVVGTRANGGVVVSRDIANTTQIGTSSPASQFGYNGIYQPRTSSTDADGYHAYHTGATKIFSTGTPGANDKILSADPCVNSFVKITTWDASLGGPGTAANAMAEIRKRYDPDQSWNASYSVANLRAYIREGWKVKDPLLENAGHDGVTIGAMPMVATITGVASPSLGFGLVATGNVVSGGVVGAAQVNAGFSLVATGTVAAGPAAINGAASLALGFSLTATAVKSAPGTITAAAQLALGFSAIAQGSVFTPSSGAVSGWLVPIRFQHARRLVAGNDVLVKIGAIRGRQLSPPAYVLYGAGSVSLWLARPAALMTALGGLLKTVALTEASALAGFDASEVDTILAGLTPAATPGERFVLVVQGASDFLRQRDLFYVG